MTASVTNPLAANLVYAPTGSKAAKALDAWLDKQIDDTEENDR